MNFSILIFAYVVVLQITCGWARSGFGVGFATCNATKNGGACLAWTPSLICEAALSGVCKYVCWPDFTSCCDCYRKPKCFPAASKVNLKNGKSIPMSDLQLGDQVQTGI